LSRRVDEIGEVIGLQGRLDDYVERYSMGMKQRLAIGCALIHRPRVLLLDEPTIGLDAASARSLRTFIASELRERENVTILYTTHYMHEAEEMSDVVGILHGGRIIAEGTPQEVAGRVARQGSLELTVRGAGQELADAIRRLDRVQAVSADSAGDDLLAVRIVAAGASVPVGSVTALALEKGAEIVSLVSSRPTLEDAFLALTAEQHVPSTEAAGAAR
jgi:ABC-2 type transport system ATP-binding protein